MIAEVFLLISLIETISAKECKSMDFLEDPKTGQALVKHVVSTKQANDESQCGIMCFVDDRCLSYNYGMSISGKPGMCEINDADHKMYPEHLNPRPGASYTSAENNCTRDLCGGCGTCRQDFVNIAPKCECSPGCFFAGVDCAVVQSANCKGLIKVSIEELIIDGSGAGSQGQCRAVIGNVSSLSVSYRIDVDLYSYRTPAASDVGHPGIGFNVQDIDNMDIVFFRTHSGAILNSGTIKNKVFAQARVKILVTSRPPAKAWFHVTAEVTTSSVKLLLDGAHATTFATSFPLNKRGAVIVRNGYDNSVKFRNFRIASL